MSVTESICLEIGSVVIIVVFLLGVLGVYMLKKLSSAKENEFTDSGELPLYYPKKALRDDVLIFIPKYWIDHDHEAQIMSMRLHLPGCKMERIKIKIWNKRRFHLLASSEFQRYKFQYKIPSGTRLLGNPLFSARDGILTCRFQKVSLMCVICGGSVSRHPIIKTKNKLGSLSSLELISVLEADPLPNRSAADA